MIEDRIEVGRPVDEMRVWRCELEIIAAVNFKLTVLAFAEQRAP